LDRIQKLRSSKAALARPAIKFLICSRHETEINRSLVGIETFFLQARHEDVQHFIGSRVVFLNDDFGDLRKMIKEEFIANAGSTFVWVEVVFRRIERPVLPNKKKVKKRSKTGLANWMTYIRG
jgi:hypothetical protein